MRLKIQWILGLVILGAVLLLAVNITLIAAAVISAVEGNIATSIIFSSFTTPVFIIAPIIYIVERNKHINEYRTMVTDRAAMNIEELHAQLYPTKVSTAVLLSESRDSIFAVATAVNDDTIASAPPNHKMG